MTVQIPAAPADSEPRLRALRDWLTRTLALDVQSFAPASSDASFRRYFRVLHPGGSLIVMDAPPAHEDSRPFVAISSMLHGIGLNVPEVLEADLEQGFLLLTDLGDRRYLDVLDAANVERLYADALDALELLQVRAPRDDSLPAYDRDLLLRDKAERKTYVVRQPAKGVQEAVLRYETLGRAEGLSLVRIELLTGRTHQIRCQFSSRGWPLVGDRKYSLLPDDCPIALWSQSLAFRHPASGEPLCFSAPPPAQWPWTVFDPFF